MNSKEYFKTDKSIKKMLRKEPAIYTLANLNENKILYDMVYENLERTLGTVHHKRWLELERYYEMRGNRIRRSLGMFAGDPTSKYLVRSPKKSREH